MAVAQTMFQQTQSFPMLALPFFMLAGALMMGGRLGQELLHFATEGMKRWRGGELSTTVVASVALGGVSGTAVANASALGSILIPWQKKRGYPAGLCAANNATSAVIDILIPPSIPMILYALVSGVSIADLFIAGVLPGLLMAVGFVATCWWIAKRRGYQPSTDPVDRMALLRLAIKSSPAIAMPILILVGPASASPPRPRWRCSPSSTRCFLASSSTATSPGRGSRRRWSSWASPPAS